ncbi:hypothetical protein Tco_1280111 [Tanacetum coccineum]
MPTPSTSQPNVSKPQTELLQTETPPTVSHEPQTEANIEQILPSPSIYQRKHIKIQKQRRAKKVTELPQTSMPLDLGADEAVHKEGVTVWEGLSLLMLAYPRRQETTGGAPAQTRSEIVLKQHNEPPLAEGHTSGSGEGRMAHTFELMDIAVLDLENRKKHQSVEILKTKEKSQEIERQRKSSISHQEGGYSCRMNPDFDDLDDLVDEGMAFAQEKDAENQGKISADDTKVVKGSGDTEAINTAGEGVSTASVPETETEFVEKTKKKVQGDAQIERDAEVALRLQAELNEELKVERERQEEASKVAIAEMLRCRQG